MPRLLPLLSVGASLSGCNRDSAATASAPVDAGLAFEAETVAVAVAVALSPNPCDDSANNPRVMAAPGFGAALSSTTFKSEPVQRMIAAPT